MTLVLASGSPRRREMLAAVGFTFEVRPADIDEVRSPGEQPVTFAERMAAEKAAAVDGEVVLAADTVVHLEGAVFPKPSDAEHAVDMLLALSGRTHRVTTGTCVRAGERSTVRSVSTLVRFRALSEAEVRRYVQSGEPLDKAGAYGIQGLGGQLVEHVEGSYTNVVGLPLSEVLADLAELGIRP